LRWQLEGTSVKVFEALPPLVDTPMTAGRDVAKVSAASVARAVLDGMSEERFEMWIGPARGLRLLHAVLPFFARRMMRYS
ncbi:MAG: hypothetical protein SF123_17870, partial [Chloroflexota bacterium]|nr:hypothetical protein [Chloroflexota bacterium]